MSINLLTPHAEELIRQKIEGGRYGSAEDVIGTALQALDERDRLQELLAKLQSGIDQLDRGEGVTFTPEWSASRARIARERAAAGDRLAGARLCQLHLPVSPASPGRGPSSWRFLRIVETGVFNRPAGEVMCGQYRIVDSLSISRGSFCMPTRPRSILADPWASGPLPRRATWRSTACRGPRARSGHDDVDRPWP